MNANSASTELQASNFVPNAAGVRAINRFILAGGRLYILTADWLASANESSVRKILDSFELTNGRELLA